MIRAAGRDPKAVKRTNSVFIAIGRDDAELERRLVTFRRFVPNFKTAPLADILKDLRENWHALVGSPEDVTQQAQALAAAGVEELMLHWMDTDETEGLELLAKEVLPRLK
jgi:alkanesulfonate monooxygenase SsuD/methylene tetrahydromethanopterin reductase-like flavin-dependent oxidoreductase (luciferase family)